MDDQYIFVMVFLMPAVAMVLATIPLHKTKYKEPLFYAAIIWGALPSWVAIALFLGVLLANRWIYNYWRKMWHNVITRN